MYNYDRTNRYNHKGYNSKLILIFANLNPLLFCNNKVIAYIYTISVNRCELSESMYTYSNLNIKYKILLHICY